MKNTDEKIESWKKKLFEQGKASKLINFKESKRSNINILEPSISKFYEQIVKREKEFTFPHSKEKELGLEYNLLTEGGDASNVEIILIEGDIATNQSVPEQQMTLKSLSDRARAILVEQRINVLYLAFGFLNWRDKKNQNYRAPLILVPVTLSNGSLVLPYKIKIKGDAIILNPTLAQKLENAFDYKFPEFDSLTEDMGAYIAKIKESISNHKWKIDEKVSLALFSFTKLSTNKALQKNAAAANDKVPLKVSSDEKSDAPKEIDNINEHKHDQNASPMDVPSKESTLLAQSSNETHTPQSSLNKTIDEVNGILAKLKNAADIIFKLENIGDTSEQQFEDYKNPLENFAKTLGGLSEEPDVNLWRGSNVKRVTDELRRGVEANVGTIIEELLPFLQNVNKNFDKLNLKQVVSFNGLDDMKALFSLCENAPKIPQEWLDREDIKDLSKSVVELSQTQATHHKALGFINKNYSDAIYKVDATSVEYDIAQIFDQFDLHLNKRSYQSEKQIYVNSKQIKATCQDGLSAIAEIAKEIKDSKQALLLPICNTLGELEIYIPFLEKLNKPLSAKATWFDPAQNNKAISLCDKLGKAKRDLLNLRTSVLSDFTESVFSIDCDGILNRFQTEYKGVFAAGLLKFFRPSYWKDINVIMFYSKEPILKISNHEVLTLLNSIKAIKGYEKLFYKQECAANDFFGALYQGELSDFPQIRKNLEEFNSILSYLGSNVSDEIKELILTGKNENSFKSSIVALKRSSNSLEIINACALLSNGSYKDTDFLEISESLDKIVSAINSLDDELGKFTRYEKTKLTYETLRESFVKLKLVQEIEQGLKSKEKNLKKTFGFLFEGLSTDWDGVKNSLAWVDNFIPYVKLNNLQSEFITKVISGQHKEIFRDLISCIDQLQNTTLDKFKWVNDLYDEKYQMWELPLQSTLNKLENCIANLHGLEEWTDFEAARKECNSKGLSEVVDIVLKEKIAPKDIMGCFEKGFYTLWLDAIAPNYSEVYQLRKESQKESISKLKEPDLEQGDFLKQCENTAQDDFSAENSENSNDVECDESTETTAPEFEFDTYIEANALSIKGMDCSMQGLNAHLCNAAKHVIEIEYPIHYDLLCKRIALLCYNKRITVKIRNMLNEALERMNDKLIRDGDFFYPKTYDRISPKTPDIGEKPRHIKHISDAEIEIAMIMLVSDSGSISKENLFLFVAQKLGFSRIGVNIENSFDKVFAELVKDSELLFEYDKVTII